MKHKKNRRNKKQSQSQKPINLRGLIVLPVVLVLTIYLVIAHQPKDQHQSSSVSKATVAVQAPDPAEEMYGAIWPIIHDGANDPVLGIRDNMGWLIAALRDGQVKLAIVPTMRGDVKAFTAKAGTPLVTTIMFVRPLLVEAKSHLPSADFRDMILELTSHEVLHLRMTPRESRPAHREYVLGESKVWARQIETITRPMMSSDRGVDPLAMRAQQVYAEVGNEDNEKWHKWVDVNLCVKSQ